MALKWGSNRNNEIEGSSSSDLIFGFGGNDILWGLQGNDWLFGGRGKDWLFGGEGNDFLSGEAAGTGSKGAAATIGSLADAAPTQPHSADPSRTTNSLGARTARSKSPISAVPTAWTGSGASNGSNLPILSSTARRLRRS